jgi:hypothetical protein
MELGHGYGHRVSQQAEIFQSLKLSVIGGATNSIFPQVEALLMNDPECQLALQHVASRKKMTRYISMIDFLFCETHPRWRGACYRYYEGIGNPLRDVITPQEHLDANRRMLLAVDVALSVYRDNVRASWGTFCELVEMEFQLAA